MRLLSVLAAALTGLAAPALAQTEQQALVDRATLTVQELFSVAKPNDPLHLLDRAQGVMICPRVFRVGFLFGGSGGGCVLSARDPAGHWSDPAFYAVGSGSFGFQAGIQDLEIIMIVVTQHGLESVMDSQFRIGGDASLTFATLGTGIEGATAADLSADILVVEKSRGLFAGISLEGSIMSTDTGWNQAYYGRALAARQIVLQHEASNPGAAPLREMLGRYSAGAPAVASAAPPPGYAPAQPGYAPPPGYGPTPGYDARYPNRAVQSAPLPPSR